jgi:hypothetical protein
MPRGYEGVAILWRKELDSLLTPLKIGNERIQCVETEGNPNTLVVSLYLQIASVLVLDINQPFLVHLNQRSR